MHVAYDVGVLKFEAGVIALAHICFQRRRILDDQHDILRRYLSGPDLDSGRVVVNPLDRERRPRGALSWNGNEGIAAMGVYRCDISETQKIEEGERKLRTPGESVVIK